MRTVLYECVLYIMNTYCTLWTCTVLYESVLYFMKVNCTFWTCTVLYERVLYFMSTYSTLWTRTVLYERVQYFVYTLCMCTLFYMHVRAVCFSVRLFTNPRHVRTKKAGYIRQSFSVPAFIVHLDPGGKSTSRQGLLHSSSSTSASAKSDTWKVLQTKNTICLTTFCSWLEFWCSFC